MSNTDTTGESRSTSIADQLGVEEASLRADIHDYLDENPVDDIEDSLKDLDTAVGRAEVNTTSCSAHLVSCMRRDVERVL